MIFLAIFSAIFAIFTVSVAASTNVCCSCPPPINPPEDCENFRCDFVCPPEQTPAIPEACCSCPPPDVLPPGCAAALCPSCLPEEPPALPRD